MSKSLNYIRHFNDNPSHLSSSPEEHSVKEIGISVEKPLCNVLAFLLDHCIDKKQEYGSSLF